MTNALRITFLCLALFICITPVNTTGSEVNCHNGSAISGIEGFDISVACNPLADEILFHRTLIEEFAKKRLENEGLPFTNEINPGSGVIGIYITSVEWIVDGDVRGYATSININVNRAALCLLEDEQFHAVSSIVWEEDRLIVSSEGDSREFILRILEKSLDGLVSDLKRADPEKYEVSTLDM